MLACVLVLLLLSPVILLTIVFDTRFSPDELAEMGVRLENSHA